MHQNSESELNELERLLFDRVFNLSGTHVLRSLTEVEYNINFVRYDAVLRNGDTIAIRFSVGKNEQMHTDYLIVELAEAKISDFFDAGNLLNDIKAGIQANKPDILQCVKNARQ